MIESSILTAAGSLLGVGLVYIVFFLFRPYVERLTGIALAFQMPGSLEWTYLSVVMIAGIITGILPGRLAYKNALYDGLSVRL